MNEHVTWKDIQRKLTSRKLWVTIAGFVSMMMIHFGAEPGSTESVVSLMMAGADALAYVIAEGLVDKEKAGSTITIDTGGSTPED